MQNKILNFYYLTVPVELKKIGDAVLDITVAALKYVGATACAIFTVVLLVMGIINAIGAWTTRNELDSKITAILKIVSYFIGSALFGVAAGLLFT